MRRSLAPSQTCKRPHDGKLSSGRKKVNYNEDSDDDDSTSPPRKPLTTLDNSSISNNDTSHEQLIQSILRRPFQVPLPNYQGGLGGRALGVRRQGVRRPLHDPDDPGALVLYTPPIQSAHDVLKAAGEKHPVHVVVDPLLSHVLRPHQREGVLFLYECIMGWRIPEFSGCIMADEMGLGKTLQCVTLLWTVLRQGPDCKPTVYRAAIVAPSSLVKNWANELTKWLGTGRLHPLVVDGGSKNDIDRNLRSFLTPATPIRPQCQSILIVSYETLRGHHQAMMTGEIGLLICDEGHRLKNCESQTYTALESLRCHRRVLLSGTPVQNDLLEYFSLVRFVNPGLVGTAQEFRKKFEGPILRGRDADATENEHKLGRERLEELVNLVKRCVLRRTQALLTKFLPVKVEFVVCVSLSEVQQRIYHKLIKSEAVRRSLNAEDNNTKMGSCALTAITWLRKLCTHPDLLLDEGKKVELPIDIRSELPPGHDPRHLKVELSGKLRVLDALLASVRSATTDKVVLVSNFTQTLDMLEKLCRIRGYGSIRLDGTMTQRKRSKAVENFNTCSPDATFVFLLSSKAGGCGLNLIGANRLILLDPDWNPANDDQAMARVWRDGQTRPCFLYRMLAAGSIEEKVFQRQTHKKALSSCVVDQDDALKHFSRADLRSLFKLEDESVCSDTHNKLKCNRCVNGIQTRPPPDTCDCSADLLHWNHCTTTDKKHVPDAALRSAWAAGVTFAFHQKTLQQQITKTEEEEKEMDEMNEDEIDEEEESDG